MCTAELYALVYLVNREDWKQLLQTQNRQQTRCVRECALVLMERMAGILWPSDGVTGWTVR